MSASFTAFYTQELRGTIGSLSHKALRIYVLLATYADKRGMCFPSIKELAEMGGIHVETVIEALRELEQLALICYARRNEKDPITGKAIPNVYIVSGCLMRSADSDFDPSSKHEPIRSVVLKTESTNNIVTNDNNQESNNQLQAPPPSTKEPRLKQQKQGRPVDYETPQQPPKTKAKAAPQNSKSSTPPYPPLPRGFDADAALPDDDHEEAARWLCKEAITKLDGGEFRAALSMANARRYIVRFGVWKCKAAVSLARRDPATKTLIGRADYLLRTSVAAEAEELQNEMNRLNNLDQVGD